MLTTEAYASLEELLDAVRTGFYAVRGFSGATAATLDHAIAAVWNPDTLARVRLYELGLFRSGTTQLRQRIVRITARGTPGLTVTPDADNAWDADAVPQSGLVLDLAAYTVQPTLATLSLIPTALSTGAGSQGAGNVWTWPAGLSIPPGAGVAIVQSTANVMPTCEVYAGWTEGGSP